jgi:hypothetical protein
MRRRWLVLVAIVGILAAAGAAGAYFASGSAGSEKPSAPHPAGSAATASARPYSRTRVERCLSARARLAPVPRTDFVMRGLHDAAQRMSFVAHVGRSQVGVAVVQSRANAELLAEVLTAPGTGYRVVQKGNAVLAFRPSKPAAQTVARRCLIPHTLR